MTSGNANNEQTVFREDFDKAEMDLLRAALKRSYAERFTMMTTLMKMGMMLKKAKITHKKDVHKT